MAKLERPHHDAASNAQKWCRTTQIKTLKPYISIALALAQY
jgi:hypothetical protein